MKRIASVFISIMIAVSLIMGGSAKAETAVQPVYTPSSYYMSSVYYSNLCDVKLTGNQRLDLINVALSQVGYHEGNSVGQLDGANTSGLYNYTEYGYWYGKNVLGNGSGFFNEWCAMFVAWSARNARIPKSIINNPAYAHVGSNPYYFNMAYHSRGTYIPKTGDLIFYDLAYSQKQWDHVGIVLYIENERVYTVEGNFSDMARLNDVSIYNSEIQGYGTPAYTNANSMAVNVSNYPIPERTLSYGMSGSDVKWLQAALLHNGYPCPIDGSFGSNTLRQLKRFQTNKALTPDGILGSGTRNALIRALSNGYSSVTDPSNYPEPSRVLRMGCKGNDVKWLQAVLKKLGASIAVDGEFGEGTKARVIWAQMMYGIEADGVCGPATRARLKAALAGGQPTGGGEAEPRSTDPASYPIPERTLAFGNSGNDVRWVQAVMNKVGMPMNITGYFGDKTKNNTKRIQRYYGLEETGEVNSATLSALKRMNASGTFGQAQQEYPEPTRNLRNGCRGEDVKWLQSAIKSLGYSIQVDGIFGNGTEAKLKMLQTALGLSADGACGPATRQAIKKHL